MISQHNQNVPPTSQYFSSHLASDHYTSFLTDIHKLTEPKPDKQDLKTAAAREDKLSLPYYAGK